MANAKSLIRPLADFSEEEPEWLVDGLIPKGQITLLASDGGVGKTSTWVALVAAISAGERCFLDAGGVARDPQKVLFLTTEDSVSKKLKKRLREAGANQNNIFAPDYAGDRDGVLQKLKFGTPEMADLIRTYTPALVVFDPLQGFLPPELNMGSRNAMRNCLQPLLSLGEETGTTFLIVCHTNKRKAAYGRDRLADSADIWDISRSVLMMGFTEEQGVRYLSHEKSNYSELQETKLFTIDKFGVITQTGTSWKRDREYQQAQADASSAPTKEACKEWILNYISDHGGNVPLKELDKTAEDYGFLRKTLKRSKQELAADGKTKSYNQGYGNQKVWYIKRFEPEPEQIELPY